MPSLYEPGDEVLLNYQNIIYAYSTFQYEIREQLLRNAYKPFVVLQIALIEIPMYDFTTKAEYLYRIRLKHSLFEFETNLSEFYILKRLNNSPGLITLTLNQMEEDSIIEYLES